MRLVALACAGCASCARRATDFTGEPHLRKQPAWSIIRTLVPDIALDIRYAGSDNSSALRSTATARRAAICCDRRRRPCSASNQRCAPKDSACGSSTATGRRARFAISWLGRTTPHDQRTKARFYPALEKRSCWASTSRRRPATAAARPSTSRSCIAMRPETCTPLDMGTDFDFFDPLRQHRFAPRDAAATRQPPSPARGDERAGFRNYPMEWWHYTLNPEPAPTTFFDVPIE